MSLDDMFQMFPIQVQLSNSKLLKWKNIYVNSLNETIVPNSNVLLPLSE